jgi:hypothetical protein
MLNGYAGGGGEGDPKEGIMVSQDYLFAVLFIMCAISMVYGGIHHTWRH